MKLTQGAHALAKLLSESTCTALGQRAKVHRSYISLLASGRRTPSLAVMRRLHKAFGIGLELWA